MDKLIYKNIFICFIMLMTSSNIVYSEDLNQGFKGIIGEMSKSLSAKDFGELPEGLEIITGKGYKGIKLLAGKLNIRIDTWNTDEGLMDRYKKAEKDGHRVVAAINATFYSSRGSLGSVVANRSLPSNIRQIPGSLSRCFLASFRDSADRQRWFIGESSLRGRSLLSDRLKNEAWFNVGRVYGWIENLIGGGGWILRSRKDVHRESFKRQRFRFRRDDQKSRHTIIAQDKKRNLYLFIFENGVGMHQIARTFVKTPALSGIRDAIFLDGGSSSTLIIKGKYFVPPLYLVDSVRFTGIQVVIPEVIQ